MSQVVSSKSVYTAWRLEVTPGVPLLPNKFVPEIENSMMKNVENISSDSRFNILNNTLYVAPGANKVGWGLNVEVDTRNILMRWHLLLGSLTSADISSATDLSVYQHTLEDTVCGYKTVTLENKKWGCELSADKSNIIVQRSYGCVPNSSKMTISNKALVKLENTVKAQGMFDVAFLVADEKTEKATKTVSSSTLTNGNLVVVATAHGLAVNDIVKTAWSSTAAFNGYFRVLTVTDANTVILDCTASGSAGTGGTINQISMLYCGDKTVKGLLSGDTVRLTNSLWATEDDTVRYVDNDNDVIGFDLITSTAMTFANSTKVELVQQTSTLAAVDFFSFTNVSLHRGTTVANALASSPIDFEQIVVTFDKKVEEIIQNLKNISTPTGLDVKIEIDKAYEDNTDRDAQRRTTSMVYVIQFDLPKVISWTDSNKKTYGMQIIFPEVVSETYNITDKTGEVIKSKIAGIAKYSFSNGYSTQIIMANDKAGTYYTA